MEPSAGERFAAVFRDEIFKALNLRNAQEAAAGAGQRPAVNFRNSLKVYYLIGYTYYEQELEVMLSRVIGQRRARLLAQQQASGEQPAEDARDIIFQLDFAKSNIEVTSTDLSDHLQKLLFQYQ